MNKTPTGVEIKLYEVSVHVDGTRTVRVYNAVEHPKSIRIINTEDKPERHSTSTHYVLGCRCQFGKAELPTVRVTATCGAALARSEAEAVKLLKREVLKYRKGLLAQADSVFELYVLAQTPKEG